MSEQIQSFNDITPDDIAGWKVLAGKHGLHQIDIVVHSEVITKTAEAGKEPETEVKEELAQFIARVPNRTTIEVIGDHGNKGKFAEANKVMIANCVLGGDMDKIEQDGTVYTTLLDELRKIMVRKDVRVKKL